MRQNRTATPLVVADGTLVVARSGRARLVLTLTCGFCGMGHLHTAIPGGDLYRRQATCQRGRYLLYVATVAGGVR